jgi:predicted ester cyclase
MKNDERIQYFYETVVSHHKMDELPDFISEECRVKSGEHYLPVGVDGMREHLAAVRNTYPDYTMKIIRQYTDGDYVISEFIMTGTHRGVFLGITPTNKVISITGVDIDKVVDGKIVEHGGAANTFDAFWEHHLIEPV